MNVKRSVHITSLSAVLLYAASVSLLSSAFMTPCLAQGVGISGSHTTTRNLDVLYPGSGDRTAYVGSDAVVDVPSGLGDAIYSANIAPWTVTNTGVVRGDNGIYLGLGGSVINQNEILGRALNKAGIFMANAGGTNSVTNESDGLITGGTSSAVGGIGVNLLSSGPTSLVDNSGRIYAYGDGVSSRGTAVLLNGGGTVTNRATGIIAGGYGSTTGIGVYIFGAGSVDNSGTITGNNYQGVNIAGGGSVVNRSGGSITGNGATIGVWISGGAGTVTNETGGIITGGRNGVVISGSGTVTNDGTIIGQNASYYGVRFSNSAASTFSTAVDNTGNISGGAAGVSIRFMPSSGTSNAANMIVNTGTISATGAGGTGLAIEGNGTFVNQINNEGTISGVRGVLIDPGATGAFTNEITNSGTIQGSTNAGLEVRAAGEVTNTGTIEGDTGVLFAGSGADTLSNSGTITGTGGTAVDMGGGNDTVRLDTGSTITGMVNGGDGTDSLTLIGTGTISIARITYFESLVKAGTETWTLTGTGSSGGSILVSEGTLAVTGTVGDAVTVSGEGVLTGDGSTGSLTNGGRVAPGNSIGVLTVDGDYVHSADAIYEVEVNPAGESDRIDVTGTATIEGGTVQVLAEQGTYQQHTDYHILHADGGVTGAFDNVTTDLAFLDPTLTYTTEDIMLALERNQTSFRDIAETYNQIAVAETVDEASLTATGDAATIVEGLLPLSAPSARLALDQMGGAVYTAFPMVDVDRAYRYLRTLFHESGAARFASPASERAGTVTTSNRHEIGPWGFWMGGMGTYGKRDGDDIASRFDYRVGGATAGADYALSETFRIGTSFGYSQTDLDFDDLNDNGDVDSYQVTLYGTHQGLHSYLDGAFYYGHNDYEMTRTIDFGTISRQAEGDYRGYELAGYLEAGYRAMAKGFEIRPMASVFAMRHHQDGFSETGADSIDLEVDAENSWSLKSTLGVSVAREFGDKGLFTWRPEASIRWAHEFGDDRYDMDARFADMPAEAFNVRSDDVARDSALLGFGITGNWGQNTQLLVFYDATIRESYTEHALTGGLRFTW